MLKGMRIMPIVSDLVIRLALGLLITTAAGSSVRSAVADVTSGIESVDRGDWDNAVNHLSRAITERGLPDADLASAYANRGYAYFGRGDVEKAVADYTAAIRLAPKEANVQSLRGWAYFVRGAMDKAIGDSTAATRLDPNFAFAFRNRGRAYLYSGRPRPAADDFAAAVKAAPGDVLAVVWLHVARVRTGQPDQQETLMNLAKVDRSKWPGPIATC